MGPHTHIASITLTHTDTHMASLTHTLKITKFVKKKCGSNTETDIKTNYIELAVQDSEGYWYNCLKAWTTVILHMRE